MRLDYQRARRAGRGKSPWWWLAVAFIAAVFLTPFVIAAVAVLGQPAARLIRGP